MDVRTGANETPTEDVRKHKGEDPMNVDIASSDGSEEGQIQDEPPVGKKRQPSPSNEEQPSPKRIRPTPIAEAITFKDIRRPTSMIPCAISINQGKPIGTLYPSEDGFAILLLIDPGYYRVPNIKLGFKTRGTKTGANVAELLWDTESIHMGHWAMSDVVQGLVNPHLLDPRINRPAVLDLCKQRDMGGLLHMKFTSWPHFGGYKKKNAFQHLDIKIQKPLNSLFQPREPYSLQIWFLAPYYAPIFRNHTLRYFTMVVEQRRHPLEFCTDSEGVRLLDRLPVVRNTAGLSHTIFQPPQAHVLQSQLPRTSVPQSRRLESPTQTAAQEAPSEEVPTVLTSESGLNSPSVQEQGTEGIDMPDFLENENPTSRPSGHRPIQGFVPADLLDMSSGSDEEVHDEPGIGSSPDAGSDGGGEGQHEGEMEEEEAA